MVWGHFLCCFITPFGPLVCHPRPEPVILAPYESCLTHLEWIIQRFTLQYPQTQYIPKKVTKINFFWNFLYDPSSNTPYETIGTEKNCLIKCFRVLGFARWNVRLTVQRNIHSTGPQQQQQGSLVVFISICSPPAAIHLVPNIWMKVKLTKLLSPNISYLKQSWQLKMGAELLIWHNS